MNIKKQALGLVLLLSFSGISAMLWLVNVKSIQEHERIIQKNTDLEFRFKEMRISLYKSNTEINNDAISQNLKLIEESLERLIFSLKSVNTEFSNQKMQELEERVERFKYVVQKYQSSHALIKNSVSYTHTKYVEILTLASDNTNRIFLEKDIQNILFKYYADTLDVYSDKFQDKESYSTEVSLLLVHVRQILKQYDRIKVYKAEINKISETAINLTDNFILHTQLEITKIKAINKLIFIFFVLSTIWLLLYGFFSWSRTQKNYLEIRSLKNNLQQFVDALNYSAIVSKTDLKGRIIYVNDKFCKVSGYSKEELLGQPHSIVRHEDMPTEMFTELWKEIRSGKTFHALIKNKAKNGGPYYVDTNISPILDTEGEIKEYIAVLYDVTELVHTRDESLYAQKSKEKFLSIMSHELRTPLNSILGFTRLLKNSLKDSKHQAFIENIFSSAHELLGLINDTLDLAKIQNGKFMIENAPFEVESVFKKLMQRYAAQAKEKKIVLVYFCKVDEKLELNGDWLRISQVISNLISNALKFTLAGGKVECSVFYTKGELRVRVEDTGVGIMEEDLNKVFAPYRQEDSMLTRKDEGSGFGLSISKDLIEMMGGRFEVKSELNIGSTFNIYLPLSQCDVPKKIEENIDLTLRYKGRVLIVEDNKTNQLMLSLMLDDLGLECEIADNGQVAIDMYENDKYDLILMNENMPIMGGIEAMLKLRELYENLVPVIAVTANVIQGDKEKFLAAGMDDYIPKPIDETNLRRVLSKYLIRV